MGLYKMVFECLFWHASFSLPVDKDIFLNFQKILRVCICLNVTVPCECLVPTEVKKNNSNTNQQQKIRGALEPMELEL